MLRCCFYYFLLLCFFLSCFICVRTSVVGFILPAAVSVQVKRLPPQVLLLLMCLPPTSVTVMTARHNGSCSLWLSTGGSVRVQRMQQAKAAGWCLENSL